MRAVILLNPHVNVEHLTKGRDYAEASIGFHYDGAIDDNAALARHLRELADMLEAPAVPASDL